jgi:hypothetical protein
LASRTKASGLWSSTGCSRWGTCASFSPTDNSGLMRGPYRSVSEALLHLRLHSWILWRIL